MAKEPSSHFWLTSCSSEVILIKLSPDYRLGFEMIQNSRLIEKADYWFQVTRYMLTEKLSNIPSNNVWKMFDYFYELPKSVFHDVHLFD